MSRRILIAGLGSLIAAVLVTASLHVYSTIQRHRFEQSLAECISQQMIDDSGVLNFKAVTDFDWDRLFIFDCYTSKRDIEQRVGTTWNGSMAIQESKAIHLLVFMKNSKIAKYAELPRHIEFVLSGSSGGWKPDQALFDLSREGNRIIAKPKPVELRERRHTDEQGNLLSLEYVDPHGDTAKWVWLYPNGKPRIETRFDGKIRDGAERGFNEDGTLKYEGEWRSDKPWNGWCYVLESGDSGSWGGNRHWKQFRNGEPVEPPQTEPKPGPAGRKQ